MRRRLTVVVAALAAMALAVPAIAAPSADTMLTAGYDSTTMQGYFTVEPFVDEVPAEEGTAEPAEEESEDGIDCTAEDAECFDVAGPNGQVNHGTIVSAFVRQFKELREDGYTGIGCLVRHIAQTDWGKGDQQVKPGDELTEPEAGGEDADETFTHEDFIEIATFCNLGADDEMDDSEESELESEDGKGNGPPPWAKAKKEKDQGGEFVPPGQQKKAGKPDRP